ncbi:MAG TPA: VWA domain-containing protein [Thermoanaerobaculia bacterium]|nr:VWA domain-containing protein [Thermoanaerobaculia bacterium]
MRKARIALVVVAVLAAAATPAQQPVQETVHVTVVEVTVHATDRAGEPVKGLGPRDVRLFVDGHDVPIESFDWVSNEPAPKAETAAPAETAARPVAGPATPETPEPPSGRLIVLFFQWHIEGAKIEGHLRMTRQALEFLDGLRPEDRVAVATFGSRLWLRQDFTNDRALLRSAVQNALTLENGPGAPQPPSLSAIAAHGADATSIEKAFIALGDALRPLPGSKGIVFFGWGIGKVDFLMPGQQLGAMVYSPEYQRAVTVLGQAQAPVFSLDVSGGHHSLEAGLERLSFETGGYYLPTYDFPRWAMKSVSRALVGHYVLVFRPPHLEKHGFHQIQLDAPSGVKLLYRQGYED